MQNCFRKNHNVYDNVTNASDHLSNTNYTDKILLIFPVLKHACSKFPTTLDEQSPIQTDFRKV